MRSGRELGRVALPTVQRRLALSGKVCFNSLWPVTNVTGQGNGLRSRIVKEKRGGPDITIEAKKIGCRTYHSITFITFQRDAPTVGPVTVPSLAHARPPPPYARETAFGAEGPWRHRW